MSVNHSNRDHPYPHPQTGDSLYLEARKEHVKRLVVDGIPYREVGRRLGITGARVGQILGKLRRREARDAQKEAEAVTLKAG